MPTAFLMQQMAWREALDEAQHVDELERLLDEAQAARRQHLKDVARALDEQADQPAALQQAVVDVRALMFIERFSSEVSDRLVALED
jgi:molecular chaperone HscB